MSEQATSTVELDESNHIRNQQREWLIQRIGWVVMFILLVAAATGLFGHGPVVDREKQSPDGTMSVEYYAVQRHAAPSHLYIRFRQTTPNEPVRLSISRQFVDSIKLESITPEPFSTVMEDEQVTYSFRAFNRTGAGQMVFRYQSDSFGPVEYDLRLNEGPSVRLSHFVCP